MKSTDAVYGAAVRVTGCHARRTPVMRCTANSRTSSARWSNAESRPPSSRRGSTTRSPRGAVVVDVADHDGGAALDGVAEGRQRLPTAWSAVAVAGREDSARSPARIAVATAWTCAACRASTAPAGRRPRRPRARRRSGRLTRTVPSAASTTGRRAELAQPRQQHVDRRGRDRRRSARAAAARGSGTAGRARVPPAPPRRRRGGRPRRGRPARCRRCGRRRRRGTPAAAGPGSGRPR